MSGRRSRTLRRLADGQGLTAVQAHGLYRRLKQLWRATRAWPGILALVRKGG